MSKLKHFQNMKIEEKKTLNKKLNQKIMQLIWQRRNGKTKLLELFQFKHHLTSPRHHLEKFSKFCEKFFFSGKTFFDVFWLF